MTHRRTIPLSAAAILIAGSAAAGQFVVELSAPLDPPKAGTIERHEIVLNEALVNDAESYAVFSAADDAALRAFLEAAGIEAAKVSEVLFVNSPTIGGGAPAGAEPREGHQVFVIERPIPGVGFFGLERKQRISQSSNAAIAKLGEIIEWERSYLTSEGTYCVYRADSSETLREHGALAGAPIGKITPVTQIKYSD